MNYWKHYTMNYRIVPGTSLQVSELCLGGNIFGHFCSFEQTKQIIDYAYSQGINFIDTANVYSDGLSETYIGEAIKGKREKFIIATKAGLKSNQKPEHVFTENYIFKSVEESLKRLQTDYIDIYQIHNFDQAVPLEETFRALNELVEQKKVKYIGCSNYTAQQLNESLLLKTTNRFKHQFVSLQNPYNLLNRDLEKELLSLCNQSNTGILAYNSLARGLLTGKYKDALKIPPHFRAAQSASIKKQLTPQLIATVGKLEEFARNKGHTVIELSLAWILAKKEINSVIVGVRNVEQLQGCIGATEWRLTAQDLQEIEKIISGI